MIAGPSWQFTLFNFPVRVHLSFFLMALLIGFRRDLILVLMWVAVIFVSILLHELGHAVVAARYGRSPHIELYMMGGLTISNRYTYLSYPQEILLSFAGPLAGFLLGGLILVLTRLVGLPQNVYVISLVQALLFVNIGWGILNLIPILPLDGGQIMRNLYHWLRNPRDERTPLIISIVFGVLGLVAALYIQQIFLAVLIAILTYRNFTDLQRGYPSSDFI